MLNTGSASLATQDCLWMRLNTGDWNVENAILHWHACHVESKTAARNISRTTAYMYGHCYSGSLCLHTKFQGKEDRQPEIWVRVSWHHYGDLANLAYFVRCPNHTFGI